MGSIQLISSTQLGLQPLQKASRIWLRILSIVLEEELKVLDFVVWLNCYYYILFDCLLFSLYFHTSPIKLTL